MADAIALLDKHIRYCEDMALDLSDIGGRNADDKAAKFSETARDLMDVKRFLTSRDRMISAFADANVKLTEAVNEMLPLLQDDGDALSAIKADALTAICERARAALAKVAP